jgi:putative membrane protein
MLTDEQVLAVTQVANHGEIEQAREAIRRSNNTKVRNFAQHMLTAHGAAVRQQTEIARHASITPSQNEVSMKVQSDCHMQTAQMRTASGANFDRQYMESQVKEHQELLDALDDKLIPSAKNNDVKAYLQKMRDEVADHLKTAKDILGSMK